MLPGHKGQDTADGHRGGTRPSPVHDAPGSRWAPLYVVVLREHTSAPPPRRLDHVRQGLRARHLSRCTEEAYVGWIRRFIFFHDTRHPVELGSLEVTKFLTSPAVERASCRLDPEPFAECPPVPVQGCAGDRSLLARWHRARSGTGRTGWSACDSAGGLGEYTQRDMPRDVAASHEQRRSFRADASSWTERSRRHYHKVGPRSVYPAGPRRGCGITQISLSSGRMVVRQQCEHQRETTIIRRIIT